ncbi:MAG: 3-deoxy-D-manno-octulosonic acid transferase [Phycisphaerae bacterium]|nr:MAG: 3-deoxy-D-manno-octulosonic acid transferase [Phycisphaerae bacterium]
MNALDFAYIPLAVVTAPVWAGKRRSGWDERFGKIIAPPPTQRPRVLLHAVSVGEVSALRTLVPLLTPHAEVVVSATTDTGLRRAKELFDGQAFVVRYPLDFSWSVRRFLDAVKPDAVALVELEVWPNFVDECAARGIPTCIINGRLSERSFRGYARIKRFIGRRLEKLAFAAVQDLDYAGRFQALGLDSRKCLITGSMKWDAAKIEDGPVPGAEDLAREMGIDRSRPLVVGGSTGPGEEAMLREAVPAGVQLLCAPRKPERFDEAARDLPGCVRRSKTRGVGPPAGMHDRFLLDSIGELRRAYSLADVVVVGRSFMGDLFGSDPIEPVALGRATVMGPYVSDFERVVEVLREGEGLICTDRAGLAEVLGALLSDPARRAAVVESGRRAIGGQMGASARHAELIRGLLLPKVGAPTMEAGQPGGGAEAE